MQVVSLPGFLWALSKIVILNQIDNQDGYMWFPPQSLLITRLHVWNGQIDVFSQGLSLPISKAKHRHTIYSLSKLQDCGVIFLQDTIYLNLTNESTFGITVNFSYIIARFSNAVTFQVMVYLQCLTVPLADANLSCALLANLSL